MKPIWIQISNVITAEECNSVIQACKPLVKPANFKNQSKFILVNRLKRNSKVTWITQGSKLDPIIHKILTKIHDTALIEHGIVLNMFEPVQFTEYKFLGHYGKHRDVGVETNHRFISASVELSPPDSYLGGGLWVDSDNDKQPSKEQGSIIIFPSILKHAAKPVWHGTRYSLVFWGQFVKNDNT